MLTARTLMTVYPLTKKLQKRVFKLADSFLIDRMELNTKNRCIYAWSSPVQVCVRVYECEWVWFYLSVCVCRMYG
ncbi:hypothetical protein EON63_12785 [archaeon]|nr:MAG: hypothetical protein EON63_12785 [archaeon]